MVTHLPIKLFTCAKRVIIMTYMFDGNILDCFLKLKGVKIKSFTEIETTKISKSSIRNLLTLLPLDEKLQDIPQSAGKYKTLTTQAQLNEISKYITRVAKRHGAKPCDVLYTFPKLIFDGYWFCGHRSFCHYDKCELPKQEPRKQTVEDLKEIS